MEFTKSIKIPLRGEDGSFLAEEKMWNPLVFAALVEFSEMEEDDDGTKYVVGKPREKQKKAPCGKPVKSRLGRKGLWLAY